MNQMLHELRDVLPNELELEPWSLPVKRNPYVQGATELDKLISFLFLLKKVGYEDCLFGFCCARIHFGVVTAILLQATTP